MANNPWDRSPRVCQLNLCGRTYSPRKVWQRFCSTVCRHKFEQVTKTAAGRKAFWAHHAEVMRVNAGPIRGRLGKYQRTHESDRGKFLHVPEELRPKAREHLARLLERARSQGKTLTPQRLASLYACAARLALYSRPELGDKSPCIKWKHRYKMFRNSSMAERSSWVPPGERSLAGGARVNDPQKLLDGI